MAIQAIVLGTLKSDGTLDLDQKPGLAPGRVQVIVQPLHSPTQAAKGIVEVMDEIRRNQKARGYQGRSTKEMHADEAAQRQADEQYEKRCQQLGKSE